MARFRVGIIGCGRPRRAEGSTGFGQGHIHAAGYEASPDCELVAAADISQDNLDAFCQRHDVPAGYLDYHEMLETEKLDIVSVCTWPHLHAQMVIDAAKAGVKAIHAEKPMAPTWGESQAMVAACEKRGVQLTLNHQRRFGAPFRRAKELLDDGTIGELARIEAFTSNLYDWGTHWFDMMFMYNDETPVEWVIGQIEARGGRSIFGVQVEGQGISFFRWQNGVYGLMVTGQRELYEHDSAFKDVLSCGNRLIGTEGVIEVGVQDGPQLRIRSTETGYQWQEVEVANRIHGDDHVIAAVLDLVDALKTGREPVLSARKALQATEMIFATYESSRRRGRVDLPLEIEDSPFLSMLEAGDMSAEESA
jgi:UDP-N-acetylglucosamine 3-dehydrogenase